MAARKHVGTKRRNSRRPKYLVLLSTTPDNDNGANHEQKAVTEVTEEAGPERPTLTPLT